MDSPLPPYFENLIAWLGVISLVTFFLSILLIPIIVNRLPQNCFVRLAQDPGRKKKRSATGLLLFCLRNFFGMILLFAGILMLFIPGQGILTILVSLLFLSIPGKAKFIRYLTTRPKIQHSLDWLRLKGNRPSFTWPEQ